MKFIFFIILLMVAQISYTSNYVDLVNINTKYTPNNNFENSADKVSILDYGLNVTFPIKIDSTKAIITGFAYEKTKFYHTLNEKYLDERYRRSKYYNDLQSLGIRFGANIFHSNKFSGLYLFVPKLAGESEVFSIDYFQLGIISLFTYKKNNRLSYKFGLYYNQEAFGNFFVPLYGLQYVSKNKKICINAILPSNADVSYNIAKNINFGFYFVGINNSYFKGTEKLNNLGYLHRLSNELSLYLQILLLKNIVVKTYIGHSFTRSYRHYAIADKVNPSISPLSINDNRVPLNSDFENGFLLELKLSYRFFIDK